MIKESSQEEYIPVMNIYISNIRKMLTAIKGEIDSNTIIAGDLNTPLTPINRSSREKIRKYKLKWQNRPNRQLISIRHFI